MTMSAQKLKAAGGQRDEDDLEDVSMLLFGAKADEEHQGGTLSDG